MGKDEFYCAADLVGREVSVIRRVPGWWCEIVGVCTGVISNVPGDDCSGVIEVEALSWDGDEMARYQFNLGVWCVENCSASLEPMRGATPT